MSDATKQAITSFQGGASNPAGSAGSNIATVTIGSSTYTGWTSISITRSVEACPNAFTFAGTESFPGTDAPIVQPGSPCTVKIGSDVVVTGYIDSYQIDVAPEQHGIVLQGRGLCEDLVDCSADIASPASGVLGGFINATSTLDLAQRLSKPFGVACRSAVSDLGPPLNGMQIALGETPYEVIERAARYCGYLVYEDENGALVLDRVGTAKMASGFTVGGDAANVESAVVDMSLQGRFSIYTVVWCTVAQLGDLSPLGNQRAQAVDTTMPRYRPLIRISEQVDQTGAFDVAQRRADWELARRYGRSQAIRLTCDSWRDSAGKLWQPNALATINAPVLKLVNQQWLIGTVTFRQDASGTHADLILMPPAAFNPEPDILQLFDAQLTRSVPASQDPAPPGSSGSGQG